MPPQPIELFDLPKPLRELLAKAGYEARLAVVARADGRPLGDYDRRVVPALLDATSGDDGGPRARDALVVAKDGSVSWSGGAAPVVEARAPRTTTPRKAAGTGTRKVAKAHKAARKPLA